MSHSILSLRRFAHRHDDLPAFHAAYLVLTFLAAAVLNMGFFAFLIVLHMALDCVKYREIHRFSWPKAIEGIVRESLIDLTLLLFGLVTAIYLHPIVTGLSGIKGLMLAELTILRGIGVMGTKLTILYDTLKILAHLEQYLHRIHPRISKRATMVEYVCLFSIATTVGLLLVGPIVLSLPTETYLRIFLQECLPWNF